ncbi:LytR C-terminal domain-containing protein [Litorihabitans aurantiacus]|uniref:LytR C-terminal domain-containing protein n=1 Tax=Litorihabitans aurantiacus TaxID=1930061 RepID=UPI0024E0512F|nr:LytR C-terminal domain-containing protein [Litorihabitans aurantiacus]
MLNGASVQGLAGRVGEVVSGDGWTTVVPGNYTSPQPQVSTIFYNNEDLLDEAQALGALLGIEPITELADVPTITVVLRPDFQE